jgi:hypothetical protein
MTLLNLVDEGVYIRQFYLIKIIFYSAQILYIAQINWTKPAFIMKTSTATTQWYGTPLTLTERKSIRTICQHSDNSLYREISRYLDETDTESCNCKLQSFQVVPHLGLQAWVNGIKIQIGSAKMTDLHLNVEDEGGTAVFVFWQNKYRGHFLVAEDYKDCLCQLVNQLQQKIGRQDTSEDLHHTLSNR